MYIQPPDRERGREPPFHREEAPIIVPRNYSGNAFRYEREPPRQAPPESEHAHPSPVAEPHFEAPPTDTPDNAPPPPETAPAWAPRRWEDGYGREHDDDRHDARPHDDRHRDGDRYHDGDRRDADRRPEEHPKELRGGFFSRFPFLSSLLPPPRGKDKKDGILPEWALIAAVILLFFSEEGENDILPFLLLLLLWD